MSARFMFCLGCLLVMSNTQPVFATDKWTPQSRELLQSLKDDIEATLARIARQEDKRGRSIENFQYQLQLPRSHRIDLGMILELNSQQSAFTVMAVTPNGLAAAHGFTADDKITSVAGVQVSAASESEILQRLQDLEDGEEFSLQVIRGKASHEVVIPVTARLMPAINLVIGPGLENRLTTTAIGEIAAKECGEISVREPPPATGELYPATFSLTDGEYTSKRQTSIRLPVGKYTVNVYELIDGDGITPPVDSDQAAKTIEINVRADTQYYLGAKLLNKNGKQTTGAVVWQAVIWKTGKQSCQL